MIVEAEVFINGPKSEVWSVITDIQKSPQIISGIKKIEVLEDPANGLIGLKWRETRMYFGKPASVEKQITDATVNEFYTALAKVDEYLFITTMRISAAPGGIRLISSHETRPQGVLAKLKSLPMIFFKGMLRKTILQDLNDIKRAVEQKG